MFDFPPSIRLCVDKEVKLNMGEVVNSLEACYFSR